MRKPAAFYDLPASATLMRKSAGAIDGFEGGLAEFLRGGCGGHGAHRDGGGEPRPGALSEKLPACASPLLLLYAQETGPRGGWHLGNFPRPFRTWRSFSARVHLIREDGRIGAG